MTNIIMKFWNEFLALLKKDYRLLLRKKKYLYLAIAFPLILSMIYIFTISPSPPTFDVGLCDLDKSVATANLRQDVRDFHIVMTEGENCSEELTKRIMSGEIVFGIEIPDGFSNELENLRQAKLITYKDNSDLSMSNYVEWRVEDSISVYERKIIDEINGKLKKEVTGLNAQVKSANKVVEYIGGSRLQPLRKDLSEIEQSLHKIESVSTNFVVNPIYLESRGIYNIKNSMTTGMAFIFPIIALFVLMLLVSTNIITDKKTSFLSRIKASKTSNLLYLTAKLVFFMGLTLAQFLVVILIFLVQGASFSINYVYLLPLLALIGLTDTLVGILVGLFSESEGVAVLISLLLTLPFMFLSGIFYPLTLLPSFLQWVAEVFPLNTQISFMKKVMLFSGTILSEAFYITIALFFISWFYLKIK